MPHSDSPDRIHDILARQAQRQPDAVCLYEEGGGVVRYGQLWQRAQEAAAWLAGQGVARGDREGYRRQELRNFQLFDAPHVAVISTDAALGEYGAIDCGGYVATFLLAAQANGVAAVPQASLAMYPEVLRETLDIDPARRVVCGISFGYEDTAHPANSYRTSRATLDEAVTWLSR